MEIILVIGLFIALIFHLIFWLSDPDGYTAYQATVGRDLGAQFKLGKSLINGNSRFGKDGKEGLKFLKKVAKKGGWDAQEACYLIGLTYLHGNGISVSYVQAEKWLYGLHYQDSEKLYDIAYKCLNVNNLTADELYDIGIYYSEHNVSEKSIELANKWFKKAISKGLPTDKISNITKIVSSDCSEYYLKKAVKSGDVQALKTIALNYYKQLGSGDGWDAYELEQKALDNMIKYVNLTNDPDAYCILGNWYSNGIGLNGRHTIQSTEWFKKAAEQNYPLAYINLGIHSFIPKGAYKDLEEAEMWFKKAAEANVVPKGFNREVQIGEEYRNVNWFDNKQAYLEYVHIYNNMYNIQDDNDAILMYENAEQIRDTDDVKAFILYKKAADLGDKDACYKLGMMYKEGIGTEQNINEYVRLITFAAEKRIPEANNELGHIYEEGIGIKQDLEKACEQYKWGAYNCDLRRDEESAKCYMDFCRCLLNGIGVEKDPNRAAGYAKLAAQCGDIDAMFLTGALFYEYRKENKSRMTEVMSWWRKAAKQGHIEAQYNLGLLYYRGKEGVNKNLKKAKEYWELAAAQGDEDSKYALQKYF